MCVDFIYDLLWGFLFEGGWVGEVIMWERLSSHLVLGCSLERRYSRELNVHPPTGYTTVLGLRQCPHGGEHHIPKHVTRNQIVVLLLRFASLVW